MSSHIMCILIGLISFNFFFLHKTAEYKRTKIVEENSDFPSDELFVQELIQSLQVLRGKNVSGLKH